MCELKLSNGSLGPILDLNPRLLFRLFQRRNNRVNFQVSGSACLCQRLAAPATVVDSKLFKDTYCSGLFQCDFADGLCGCGHFDLLELQLTEIAMSATATLVTPKLNMPKTVEMDRCDQSR